MLVKKYCFHQKRFTAKACKGFFLFTALFSSLFLAFLFLAIGFFSSALAQRSVVEKHNSAVLDEGYKSKMCVIHKVGEIPLRDDDGYLSVPVSIHGQAFRMIVDTGSEGSLISPAMAKQLDLPPDPGRKTVIYGSRGNNHITSNVQIPELKVGDITFHRVSVPLGALPGKPRIFPPIEGLIGGDLLSYLEVEFDVPHKRLSFYALQGANLHCLVTPPWKGSYVPVPLSRIGHRVMLEVALDHKPVVALLDSGARTRVLSTQAAHRLGISDTDLASRPGGTASSVAGQETVYHWYKFKDFSIGAYDEKNPVITVLPINDFADMLLGASWFANKRVWVSYSSGQLFIQNEPR